MLVTGGGGGVVVVVGAGAAVVGVGTAGACTGAAGAAVGAGPAAGDGGAAGAGSAVGAGTGGPVAIGPDAIGAAEAPEPAVGTVPAGAERTEVRVDGSAARAATAGAVLGSELGMEEGGAGGAPAGGLVAGADGAPAVGAVGAIGAAVSGTTTGAAIFAAEIGAFQANDTTTPNIVEELAMAHTQRLMRAGCRPRPRAARPARACTRSSNSTSLIERSSQGFAGGLASIGVSR